MLNAQQIQDAYNTISGVIKKNTSGKARISFSKIIS
jgi:hypothetical protein